MQNLTQGPWRRPPAIHLIVGVEASAKGYSDASTHTKQRRLSADLRLRGIDRVLDECRAILEAVVEAAA